MLLIEIKLHKLVNLFCNTKINKKIYLKNLNDKANYSKYL